MDECVWCGGKGKDMNGDRCGACGGEE